MERLRIVREFFRSNTGKSTLAVATALALAACGKAESTPAPEPLLIPTVPGTTLVIGCETLNRLNVPIPPCITATATPRAVTGIPGTDGKAGKDGKDGKSAYELAKDHGFIGTEDQYIASLTGATGQNGKDGKSAYQIWLDAGNTGSVSDYLKSIQGPQGNPGAAGKDGKDGKDGATGAAGPQGPQGPRGPQGERGDTAAVPTPPTPVPPPPTPPAPTPTGATGPEYVSPYEAHTRRLALLDLTYRLGGIEVWLKKAGFTYDAITVDARNIEEESRFIDGKTRILASGVQVNVKNASFQWPNGMTTTQQPANGRCIKPDEKNPSMLCTNVTEYTGPATLFVDLQEWPQLKPAPK